MITNEQIVRDVQALSAQHFKRWSGNGLDRNDLESEALNWVWPRFEALQTMHSMNAIGYNNYLKTSIKRLLDRFCQEELVRTMGFNGSLEGTGYTGFKGYTFVTAKLALEKKDRKVFEVAETCCTVKQLAALEGVFLEGFSYEEVAGMLGVKRQTVHSAVDRAIHNIVSRSAGW